MKSFSNSVRLGVLQSPAMYVSAKPMSPDFKAAGNTFQLRSEIIAPLRIVPPPPASPKNCKEPSGNCNVSDPWRRRDSIFRAVRAAAGALRGFGAEEMAVMVMAFERSKDGVSGSPGDRMVGSGGFVMKFHTFEPQPRSLQMDVKHDA